ncbi:hypothetical protein L209DRAFT_753159 [Thermothelomyces heterothallicus CBS 203.75]
MYLLSCLAATTPVTPAVSVFHRHHPPLESPPLESVRAFSSSIQPSFDFHRTPFHPHVHITRLGIRPPGARSEWETCHIVPSSAQPKGNPTET